jgi:hypothetical protein
MRPCRRRPARGDFGPAGTGLHRPARPKAQPKSGCQDASAGPDGFGLARPSREEGKPAQPERGVPTQPRRPSQELSRAGPGGSGARRPRREWSAPAQPGVAPRRPRRELPFSDPGGLLLSRPSRNCCCAGVLAKPGSKSPRAGRERPNPAQDELDPAKKGQNHYMPAHRRIFWPENIYAGRGNAGVNPGPTYVGRDINMPARGSRVPARRCRCRSETSECRPGQVDVSPGS